MLASIEQHLEQGTGTGPDLARVCIGDVVLSLAGLAAEETELNRELAPFCKRGERDADADIEVTIDWAPELHSRSGDKAFDSGSLWTLTRENEEFVFDFASPFLGAAPYKRMRVDPGFRSARITLSRRLLGEHSPVSPMEYPTDELLITNYLAATGQGVEVHGCGLVDPEHGAFLFLGHSGAGKSTTTMLWKSLRDPEILSDDRLILRLHEGELWMYGTPWHGEAGFASAAKASLKRIFILQHGQRNRFRRMPMSEAVGELFARCFPPFHSALGLRNTVEFLNQVASTVPCCEFQFIPGPTAVEAVLAFQG